MAEAVVGKVHRIVGDCVQGKEVGVETALIETGVLDSFGILEVTSALEQAFEIQFTGEDLSPGHFHSVATLAELIETKLP